MTREDLFLAFGDLEESRLARTEIALAPRSGGKGWIFRTMLVAAVIVSLLAVTAYAVAGFVLYDSPAQMLTAIFGNNTGFDHSEGGVKYFEDGMVAAIEPTFDRVAADETVVQEEIAENVDIVGQSARLGDYTLTVDAFLYDSATRCGFFTYLLENPKGIPRYNVQSTGEIWFEGRPDPVQVNQYGYAYLIQEKTTETCLAVTYYFQWDARRGEMLEIYLQDMPRYTPEEFSALIADDIAALKEQMPPEEAVAQVSARIGEENFALAFAGYTEAEIAEQCYAEIAGLAASERIERENTGEAIRVPCGTLQPLRTVNLAEDAIVISPVSVRVDVRGLAFLHTDKSGAPRIHTDNIDSLAIRFKDGSEYVVYDGYICNYMFSLSQQPEENVQTEVFVSPEEEPMGEGYFTVENTHNHCIATVMFNRIIDLSQVEAVVINGTVLPAE